MTMNGKIVMVTGATNGIGEVTARDLAGKGAEVIIISRNQTKLDNTVNKIKSETGNENVSWMQADLSSMESIRDLAAQFHQHYDRLDGLVNNAGAYFNERKLSVDGYEMTFALNHLNYFLLTHLLLDTLKQTAQEQGEARIVNVSSGAHYGPRNGIQFDEWPTKENYSGFSAYGESKLMNVMFTFELARRLEGTNVTANVLHPGFVRTGFGKNNGTILNLIIGAMQLFAISAEEGAQTSIYLASSPEVEGVSGKYWDKKRVKEPSDASKDVAAQQRLWSLSEELTGLAEEAPEPVTV